MTQQQKREAKLNNVLHEVKDRLDKSNNIEWANNWRNQLNMIGFLYGCDRLNDMQALTRLIFAGIACDMTENDILKLLADKGDLYYEAR